MVSRKMSLQMNFVREVSGAEWRVNLMSILRVFEREEGELVGWR